MSAFSLQNRPGLKFWHENGSGRIVNHCAMPGNEVKTVLNSDGSALLEYRDLKPFFVYVVFKSNTTRM